MMDSFFLSRLRKNAVIREVYDFNQPYNTAVLSDKMVLIGNIQNRAENYFRLLKVMDSKGKDLHLITNRFDLSADEILEMYKSRWAIELFFVFVDGCIHRKSFSPARYYHADAASFDEDGVYNIPGFYKK